MINSEVAEIFNHMADLLELKGVKWKPRAYRKAARAIELMSENLGEIYEKDGLDGLEDISGVGEGLAERIEEFIKKGRISDYEKLKKQMPKGITNLTDIQGVGPKVAQKLVKKLDINSLEALREAAKAGKVAKIEGFGPKTEENILRGIKLLKSQEGRMLLGAALPMAEEIVDNLNNLDAVDKANLAGSIRRGRETIGDIDILVSSKKAKKVMDHFTSMKMVKDVLLKGETKSSVIISKGMHVDLRVMKKDSYGSALQYFTGSKDHGVKVRKVAMDKGYKLSEYGLFSRKTNKKIAGKDEKEIYKKLGLAYIPPELRENMGEVDAAKKNQLPNLIKLDDIKGDFHVHTKYSDGDNTVEEMIKKAKGMGYEYVAITDHSPSEPVAKGLKPEKLLERNKEIRKIAKKIKGIKVLVGSEVDILDDGSLDYDDDILKKLDIVIAAVHRKFKMPKEKMTKRVVKAMSNENVNILAHPMARKIRKREAILLDMKKIFDAAKENNVALEINSQPKRLDLDYIRVKEGKEAGVKFVINTDSHSTGQMENIKYGVIVARRGWLESKHVLNTKSLSTIGKFFKVKLD